MHTKDTLSLYFDIIENLNKLHKIIINWEVKSGKGKCMENIKFNSQFYFLLFVS